LVNISFVIHKCIQQRDFLEVGAVSSDTNYPWLFRACTAKFRCKPRERSNRFQM